jgi:O-antigen/teichoic acid export membrane protein
VIHRSFNREHAADLSGTNLSTLSARALYCEPCVNCDVEESPFVASALLRRFRPLASLLQSKSSWALADQAVLSLGNFLTNLVLARAFGLTEYGVYAFALAMLLFLNNLHGALIGYPLTVRGAAAETRSLQHMLTLSVVLTIFLTLLGGPILAISLWIFGHPGIIPAAILALLMWQLQETARRGLLAKLRYRDSMIGDALSYLGQVTMLWLLSRNGHLTLQTALLVNAGSSAVAMIVQLLQVGMVPFHKRELPGALREAWRLGRWLLLSNAITIFVVPIIPWTLAFFQGAHEVAGYQALATVLGISHPVLFSIVNIIVPASAQARATGGLHAAREAAFQYAKQGACLLLPYYAFLLLFPQLALRTLYGPDSPYVSLTHPLQLFVLFYVLLYASQVLMALMNGTEKTSASFFSQVASAVVTVAIAVPFTAHSGLTGACWGRVAQGAGTVAASMWLWQRIWGKGVDNRVSDAA